MANPTISIRVPLDVKKRFEERVNQEGLSVKDKILDWVEQYLQGAGEIVKTTSPVGAIGDFLREHNLILKDFSFDYYPMMFFSEDMDFSWMFSGEDLRYYYIEAQGGSVSSSGWLLVHWLWVLTWSWLTSFGFQHRIPVEKLLLEWKKGEDPVQSVVALGGTEIQYANQVRDLIKAYTTDKERVARW